ncbi:MAG: ABC transporter permease [Clostridia bacterium]|nr:ABC transporter permease [Clostridia bacterium]
MIFKFAFRNLARLPWRSLLYFSAVFFIIAAMTASLLVYGACADAKDALDESYIFVASLVRRDEKPLSVKDLFLCLKNTEVEAFNVTMSEGDGVIPGGDAMFHLPDAKNQGSPSWSWVEEFGCRLVAAENLFLVPSFFSGECTIREGTGLSERGYTGQNMELVIPWWLAEKYGIGVGDQIIRRYYTEAQDGYIYIPSEVVGIYETKLASPDVTRYPAYLPLGVAELDYAKALSDTQNEIDDIEIERADFVLPDRGSFESFVMQARENGVNFNRAKLIFNNSDYDALSSELDNIHMIALCVCVIVCVIGACVLLFFTLYRFHSGRQERRLLRALGMPRSRLLAMIMAELGVLIVAGALTGFVSGYAAADGICRLVGNDVLRRATASETIQNTTLSLDYDQTMPLAQKTEITVSVKGASASRSDLPINPIRELDENEFAIQRHTFYTIGTSLSAYDYTYALPAADVVGITDLDVIETSIRWEEITSRDNYRETFLYAFVSESSPYAPDPETGATVLHIMETTFGSLSKIAHLSQNIHNEPIVKTIYLVVVGTYSENEFCSGTDILVPMEAYRRLYTWYSIATEEYYFDRIGTVYRKEENG